MSYNPVFSPGEYRSPAKHYEIMINGKRLIYVYIRKNACSAFKRLMVNQLGSVRFANEPVRLIRKAKYFRRRRIKYFMVPNRSIKSADEVVFVYRDPLDRFISTYINKFIDDIGSGDIKANFESVMEIPVCDATFVDFINYTSNDFSKIDCHLRPQKSHLLEMRYSQPVNFADLRGEMAKIIGDESAEKWFAHKVNASSDGGLLVEDVLVGLPVRTLRAMKSDGHSFKKSNFINGDVVSFVRQRYSADYDMIDELNQENGLKATA